MGAVQTLESGDYTLADLDALPDDGKQRELVDGMLLMTPSPSAIHQRAVFKLGFELQLVCPEDLEIFSAPFDYRPTSERSLQPDLFVCHPEDVGPRWIEKPLLLAVEVLSPSTRMKDLLLKRGVYEQAGVASYWLFDPETEVLTVLELSDGRYVERAIIKANDVFEAELPFPVRIIPAELVRHAKRSAT